MKKTVISFVVLMALCFSSCAVPRTQKQNSNQQILSVLAESDDTEHISIGSVGMFLIKAFGGIKEIPELKGIKSVDILTAKDGCPKEKKAKIRKQVASLSDGDGYETLMSIKDKGDKVNMLIRQEKDIVKEFLLAVVSSEEDDDNDSVVIRIKGKMLLSDLQKMIKKSDFSIKKERKSKIDGR